jgi:TRAP-type uncharacterized transport system substrate-binding protein
MAETVKRARALLGALLLLLPALSLAAAPVARAQTDSVQATHARAAAADVRGPPPAPLAIDGPATLGLMGAQLGGTFLQIASDISVVVSAPNLRVVPLVGKGSLQNIGDLLNLRGVDLALVATDAARFAETRNLYPNLHAHVTYIAKLYDQELQIVAGPDIHSLADLAGKVVSADAVGAGTGITAETLFDILKIPAKITHDTPTVGVQKLMRGEVVAVMDTTGKPAQVFAAIPANSGLHLVAVPASEALLQIYLPASFTHADYPNLVPEGATVEAIAVPVLLVAYNWPADSPRYRNLALFTDFFFSHAAELLQPPFHPKWRDMNLRANVPGWTRAPYAQAWLDREAARTAAATAASTADRAEETAFTQWAASIGLTSMTPVQHAQLFSLWKLRRGQAASAQ